jgi:hypothetical protein
MNIDETPTSGLGSTSSGFALAAAITVLFNTGLAWAKDACKPLNKLMASLTGHHWITHAIADIVLFVVLGLIFAKLGTAEKIAPGTLINVLTGAVIVAALGLVGWYFVT